MSRRWRVYHPDPPVDAGAEFELSSDEAHHVARVLRLGEGDGLAVFDGRGGEWEAVVTGIERRRVTVRLGPPVDGAVEPPLALVLVQGRGRAEKMDWVVQKATEIGFARIVLAECSRSEGAPPGAGRIERWRRIAVEACKQSGRRRVPDVEGVEGLPAPPAAAAFLLDPQPGLPPLGAELASRGARPPAAALAVGPESGFTDDEVRRASEAGWRRAGLGPRVLRTETAGLVAGALLLHAWGDLGGRSGLG